MEDRITGSWPGGPRREGGSHRPTRAPRLPSAEEVEAARDLRLVRRRRKARTRRMVVGLSLSLVAAGGIGWTLGQRSHTTASELTAEAAVAKQNDITISSEVNRALLELWKMEDVEAARNGGRIR